MEAKKIRVKEEQMATASGSWHRNEEKGYRLEAERKRGARGRTTTFQADERNSLKTDAQQQK
jgi:hypothetical protein